MCWVIGEACLAIRSCGKGRGQSVRLQLDDVICCDFFVYRTLLVNTSLTAAYFVPSLPAPCRRFVCWLIDSEHPCLAGLGCGAGERGTILQVRYSLGSRKEKAKQSLCESRSGQKEGQDC